MHRIDRITAILTQLQAKKVTSAKEIAERFDISIRTVYRDIRTLEEAGVPIYSVTGKGYSIVEGYHLPPVMFSPNEVGALITSGNIMNSHVDEIFYRDYQSALYKIKAVLKNDTKQFAENLDQRVKVYNGSGNQALLLDNILNDVQSAICSKRVMSILYLSGEESESNRRMIEPRFVGFMDQKWYVIAFCRLRGAYRNFRLDRIKEYTFENTLFKEPDLSINEILQQMLSYKDRWNVTLRVEKGHVYKAIKQRYGMGFISENDLGNKVAIELQADSLEVLSKQLFEYGGGIEIIQPFELKVIIRRHLDQIMNWGLNMLAE